VLQAVADANPNRDIAVITNNLAGHKRPQFQDWLNLQESWWRLFRREALAG
jgi:hypothetical protein